MGLRMVTVASGYPSDARPAKGTFVRVLMRDLQSLGAAPVVIAPESVLSLTSWKIGLKPGLTAETRDDVEIRRPRYLSFSNKRLPWGASTYRWTVSSFGRAVLRGARSLVAKPDLCYGHFLYPAGVSAQRLAERLGTRSVVALGESSFDHYERHLGLARVREDLARFTKVVSVSEATEARCVERYKVTGDRLRTFSNAAASYFRPGPSDRARQRLGLPIDRPIVAFVGHFDDNKGPHRILKAIETRREIGAVFLGSGPMEPTGPQVLFSGRVRHEEVPQWLNAADILVHPVMREGSSNSLREALACGVPVVTSRIPSNLELVDSRVGVLVDPHNVSEIRDAIWSLIDDPDRRTTMSHAAVERAREWTSADRARKIMEWIAAE